MTTGDIDDTDDGSEECIICGGWLARGEDVMCDDCWHDETFGPEEDGDQ